MVSPVVTSCTSVHVRALARARKLANDHERARGTVAAIQLNRAGSATNQEQKTMDTTLTTDSFQNIDLDQMAFVTGANGFTDGAGRVLNAMGNDAQNGAAVGAVGGAVVGGVAGGVSGAAAGGVGAVPGAVAGAWTGSRVGAGIGAVAGGVWGLGRGLGREAGLWK
jgi:hypothetical protein